MMKFYGTIVCPDCVKAREALNAAGVLFDYVDITVSTANMKEFLYLRDTHREFDAVKKAGAIGVPCFLQEDGSVVLDPQTLLEAAQQ